MILFSYLYHNIKKMNFYKKNRSEEAPLAVRARDALKNSLQENAGRDKEVIVHPCAKRCRENYIKRTIQYSDTGKMIVMKTIKLKNRPRLLKSTNSYMKSLTITEKRSYSLSVSAVTDDSVLSPWTPALY